MKRALVWGLLLLIVTTVFLIWRMDAESPGPSPIVERVKNLDVSVTVNTDFSPQALAGTGEPQHPFLATNHASMMHAGSWESDVHPKDGVFANADNLIIRTRRAGSKAARQCATFTFTSQGMPLIMCGGLTSFRMQLLDPNSLEMLATYHLPMRPSSFQAMVKRDPEIIFLDTSGGAYFYLDNEDRAVLADAQQNIRRVKPVQTSSGKWELVQTDIWDMTDYVPNDCLHYNNWFPKGECDALTTVMPDYSGLLWWVTRNGRMGSLDPETGTVKATAFAGEEIQNSFGLDQNGAYIATDHALYHVKLVAGLPTVQWRMPYDRGSGRKIGSINQGSGTSPTLFGKNYVTITDNADGRINLVVAYRGDVPDGRERQICKVAVFPEGASATDNSMIAIGRSVILENNHGYTNVMMHKDYGTVTGGVVRVDVREDESGCDIVWESDLKVPSVVPKLTADTGIAYFYTFDELTPDQRLWSLVGLDFQTGQEVIRVPTGTGQGFNNNWSSIAMAPNGETYIGTREGIIQIRSR